MDAVAEGLWGLAEYHEQKGEIAKAIKCLEAVCQSSVSFLPIMEVKTRLRIATLLLRHCHNVNHAKAHLERSVFSFSVFLSLSGCLSVCLSHTHPHPHTVLLLL